MHWEQLRIGINQVGRVRCEPGWQLDWNDPARLVDCDLWFVWAGRGRMRLTGGTALDLHAGVCLWMRPGRTYEAVHDPADPLGVTYLHFDLRRPDGERVELSALPPEVHEVEDFAFVDAATRRVVELLQPPVIQEGGDHSSRQYEARVLLLSVLAALDRQATEGRQRRLSPAALENHRRIAGIVSAITENPGFAPTIAELAQRSGYSAVHFSRVFREVMGESPQTFLIKTRLQRAQRLLAESNLPVGEIAVLLGYPDVFFFSRQFKEKTGRSPSEYRGMRG